MLSPYGADPRRPNSYGSLIAWAKRLDREDCAAILEQNLKEAQAADQRLAELADRDAGLRAA